MLSIHRPEPRGTEVALMNNTISVREVNNEDTAGELTLIETNTLQKLQRNSDMLDEIKLKSKKENRWKSKMSKRNKAIAYSKVYSTEDIAFMSGNEQRILKAQTMATVLRVIAENLTLSGCSIGYDAIAQEANCSERTVRRVIQIFSEKKVLQIERRFNPNNKGRKPNRIYFLGL